LHCTSLPQINNCGHQEWNTAYRGSAMMPMLPPHIVFKISEGTSQLFLAILTSIVYFLKIIKFFGLIEIDCFCKKITRQTAIQEHSLFNTAFWRHRDARGSGAPSTNISQ